MTIDTSALRQLLAAATDRPWRVEYLGEQGYSQRISNDAAVIVAETFQGPPLPAADAELIVTAVNNLLPLLERVAELEHEVFVLTNSDPGRAVLLEAALTRATGRQKALAGILDELFHIPWENGHPGYAAVRTHWIKADRVSEWRTLLPTYATPIVVDAGTPAEPTWRDYSLHQYGDGDSDVAVLCRSDSGCEDFEANAEGRYLTLGEAADWAKGHVAEHARRAADDTVPKPLPKRVKGATYPGHEATK